MLGAQKIKTRERAKELRDLWRTPRWLLTAIEKHLGLTFTVDVACDASNALLPNYIGVEKDALVSSWGEAGTVAFLNPPYSAIGPWIDAAIREKQAGVTTVMLIPMSLDTLWFENLFNNGASEVVVIIGGRVAFVEPDVHLGLVEMNVNPGGSMLVVFDGNERRKKSCLLEQVSIRELKELGGYVKVRKPRQVKPKT